MAKPWGGAGAWAAESELAEALPLPQPPFSNDSAFPSLGEAASTKPKKKKAQQTLSLSEFTVGIHVGPRSKPLAESKGLTAEEMMMLPTGPRDRSDEEPQPFGTLGGGFKDYGAYRGGGREYGDRDRSGGGFRDGNRGGFGGDRDRDRGDDGPSRADANDDWGSSKKFVPQPPPRYDDDRRRGSSRSSDRDFSSKADEDDNWGSSKKFVAPPNGSDRRGVGRYDDLPSRGGFHDSHGPSKADEVDNWGSSKKSAFGFDSSNRERDYGIAKDRDSGADADKWSRKDVSRFPERPRLVLQPRTRPVESSPPPSRGESENNSPERILPDKTNMEVTPKPRKVNPFGEAKPREIILEEKGMKWKKFDAELDRKSVDRAETEEELVLKEEIKALQEAIKVAEADSKARASEVSTGAEEDQILLDVREQLAQKEWDLEQLTTELNDKVRFSRVGGERPASRSGNRETDMWTKSNGNGQPKSESKGGRW